MPTCQICQREIKFKDGERIAHHGYQRPGSGWQTASCFGARYRAWEVACDAVEAWVEVVEAQRLRMLELAHGTVDKLYLQVKRDHYAARHREMVSEMVTEATLADITAKHPHWGQFHRAAGGSHYEAPTWEGLVAKYRADRLADVASMQEEINTQRTRLRLWKPQPLKTG